MLHYRTKWAATSGDTEAIFYEKQERVARHVQTVLSVGNDWFVSMTIYLFICCLFNDTVSNSDYAASNDATFNQ